MDDRSIGELWERWGHGAYQAIMDGKTLSFWVEGIEELRGVVAKLKAEHREQDGIDVDVSRVRCLLYPVGDQPREVMLVDRLDEVYHCLGCGTIQSAFRTAGEGPDRSIDIICDDEGKLDGAHPNRAVYTDDGGQMMTPDGESDPADVIYGDFLVMAIDETSGMPVSMRDEEVADTAKRLTMRVDRIHDPYLGDYLLGIMCDDEIRPMKPTERTRQPPARR